MVDKKSPQIQLGAKRILTGLRYTLREEKRGITFIIRDIRVRFFGIVQKF
jgi:hypothetical protein